MEGVLLKKDGCYCKFVNGKCIYPNHCSGFASSICLIVNKQLFDDVKCRASVSSRCNYRNGCVLFGTEECIL